MPRRRTGYLNKTVRTLFWTVNEQLVLQKSEHQHSYCFKFFIFFLGGGFTALFSSIFEHQWSDLPDFSLKALATDLAVVG
jgi:hypothetical protein